MMVVELIANMPPRKMQLIFDHPKRCPARMPMVIMQKTMVIVAMMGAAPIFKIFLKEKSSPKENNVNMTPMFAHVSIFSSSMTDMVYGMLGPTRNPATKYPNTRGCLSFLKTMVTIPATMRIRARSLTSIGKSDMAVLLIIWHFDN